MNRKAVKLMLVFSVFCITSRAWAEDSTLHNKTLKSSPTVSDETYLWDVAAGALKKTTLGKLPLSTAQAAAMADKADKASAVVDWASWPTGSVFIFGRVVSYQGVFYTCLQTYQKADGDTPDALTSTWKAVIGGVTSYADLTNKPTIPSALADLADDSSHRTLTDAKIAELTAKQAPLTAGTDYLSPTGSAALLTGFPSDLATDAEVATAVANKADAIAGTSGQVPIFDSNNVLTATTIPTVTGAEIGGVFSGSGAYLKKDGTSGDPSGSGTFAGLSDLPSGVTLTTLEYAASGASSNLQAQISALSASGFSPTIQAADPTGSSANGWYMATGSGDMFNVTSSGIFTIPGTYVPWDLTPNEFSFTAITGATADGALNCSETITPDGYDRTTSWTTSGDTGCSAKIAGGSAATSGSISPGQTISACVNSSQSFSTITSCTPIIGGVAATQAFSVTTITNSTIGSDNFDATTDEYLSAHTPLIGGSWVVVTGTPTVSATGDYVSGSTSVAYINTTTPDNVTIESNVSPVSAGSSSWSGPFIRVSSSGAGYSSEVSGDGKFYIIKRSAGGTYSSILASQTTITDFSVAKTYKVIFTANGTVLQSKLYDGDTLLYTLNATDGTYTSGYGGIILYGASARVYDIKIN